VIPHVPTERTKPVTELPTPTSNAIYDVQVFEPHKGIVFTTAEMLNTLLGYLVLGLSNSENNAITIVKYSDLSQ